MQTIQTQTDEKCQRIVKNVTSGAERHRMLNTCTYR
jgi:hypothetical protein